MDKKSREYFTVNDGKHFVRKMIRSTCMVTLLTCLVWACDGKRDTWYTSTCELLCDEEKGQFLDIEKLKKYKIWYPYDTIQKVKEDSVIISFDFITECCKDFKGDIDVAMDTLILQYGLANDTLSGCDCYCDYRMIYRIDKRNRNWSAIKIVNSDGSKIY